MNIEKIDNLTPEEVRDQMLARASSCTSYIQSKYVPCWIRDYENLLWYNARRFLVLKELWLERQYNPDSKTDLIERAHNTFSWMLSKLNLKRVRAASYAGKKNNKGAKMYEKACQWIFSREDNNLAINQAIDEALLTGNGFLKIMWKNKNLSIVDNYKKKKDWSTEVVSHDVSMSYPVLKYVSVFDAIIDPYWLNRISGDRCFMTEKQIRELYTIEPTKRDLIKDKEWYYLYDYNRVKDIKSYQNKVICDAQRTTDSLLSAIQRWQIQSEKEFYSISDDSFEVIDLFVDIKETNGKYVTYNCVIINQEMIYRWPSQYAFEWSPIVHFRNKIIPWVVYWSGLWDMWASYQAEADRLQETKMIAINMLGNPMFSKETEIWRNKNNSQVFSYKARWFIEAAPWQSNAWISPVRVIEPSQIAALSSELDRVETKFNAKVWLNPYTEGGTWGIERSSKWASLKYEASSNKIVSLVNNISSSLSNAAEKCVLLIKAHGQDIELDDSMSDDEIQSITVKDISNWYNITFRTDDLIGGNADKLEQLVSVIQYVQGLPPDPVTWENPTNYRALVDKIYELAGISELIQTPADKKAEQEERYKYLKESEEIRNKYIPPVEWPEVKPVNISLTMRLEDILAVWDENIRAQLFEKVGIQYQPQQQAQQQQLPQPLVSWQAI